MTRTSWVELCVSDFEQSITWFEHVLGFRVVARDAHEYAELSRGETSLQLAADDAAYWKPERPRLLPPGQRGSGVEIVLLVDNVEAVYRQAQQARADIVRPLADYPWHMRQFWVRHPDGYLIRPAQQSSLKRYQELRVLSGRLNRWEELRRELLAFLEQTKNTSLLIQIALDEGDIDQALQRLQWTAKKDGYGYTYSDRYGYYGYSDVAFEVARAAEEIRLHAAIELYRQFAERLIAMRDRKRYELACTYLVKVRALYEKLGEGEAWRSYVTALREQTRNLRALKEELANAGL